MCKYIIPTLNIKDIEIEKEKGLNRKFGLRSFRFRGRNIAVLIHQNKDSNNEEKDYNISFCIKNVYDEYLKMVPEDKIEFFEYKIINQNNANCSVSLKKLEFMNRKEFSTLRYVNKKFSPTIFNCLNIDCV